MTIQVGHRVHVGVRDRSHERVRRGLVLYGGHHVLPLGDDTWAVPISALWEG